ncbi:hypothetical protein B0H13DRAFT_1874451 [Mycena leptocephala]|nr:hypothetical protein B0H13DRAFT_1874451 [Mycena leptocephala]
MSTAGVEQQQQQQQPRPTPHAPISSLSTSSASNFGLHTLDGLLTRKIDCRKIFIGPFFTTITLLMDVSPQKKPPFSPRKSTLAATPDDNDEDPFDAMNRPLGMALLLHSVYTAGSHITTTSAIPIAQKVIDALLEANADLPSVTLSPFSHTKISTRSGPRLQQQRCLASQNGIPDVQRRCQHPQREPQSHTRRLQDSKRETRAQHESTQLSITAVSKSVSTLGSTVDHLHSCLSNHASAFLVLAGEQSTRAKLTQVQPEIAQHQSTLKFVPEEFHVEAKAECPRLYKEQISLTKSLAGSAGQSIALLGGTLTSSLPPPEMPPSILRTAPPTRPERSRSPSLPPVNKKRKEGDLKDNDSLITEPPHKAALNMNGLGGPGKISHVNSVISQRAPHAFVISETKTNEKLSSKLPSFEYNIFEEEAVPSLTARAINGRELQIKVMLASNLTAFCWRPAQWSDVLDRDRRTCWTSRARGSGGGGNIIDRIISSKAQLVDSEIGVADKYSDFVPSTDHRAVVGKLVYVPPSGSIGNFMVFSDIPQVFNQLHIKFPYKSEKHRFTMYKDAVDRRIKLRPCIRSPALTKVLVPCAEKNFGRTSRYKKGHAVTSPKLQAIVASIRSIGVPVSFAAMKTLNYHAAEYSHLSVVSLPSFREYLVSKRRSLNKELYAEKMAEIFSRAKLQDRNRMIAALCGGSTKKLVATGGFISLKWCVKALSDDALSLVLDLHNYVVMNSRFPGDLKDMWITMFHKHGLRMDLKNWRVYSSRMGIVPETQVAVQQGVQTRDLMSFLASIQTWSEQHKETIYAVKRDQMKGFDYLAPEGFYDAVLAYGLPQSIIDLDRAAQADTKCRIQMYYGPTV